MLQVACVSAWARKVNAIGATDKTKLRIWVACCVRLFMAESLSQKPRSRVVVEFSLALCFSSSLHEAVGFCLCSLTTQRQHLPYNFRAIACSTRRIAAPRKVPLA